jgi:hypothetical protein
MDIEETKGDCLMCNEFQSAIDESTHDQIERYFNKIDSIQTHINSIPSISCDDVLTLAVPFRNRMSKKRLKSMSSFVDRMILHDATFNAKHYYSGSLNSRIKPLDYHSMTNKLDYQPVYLVRCKSDQNTIIEYSNNYLFFTITKLAHFNKSRFNAAIQAVIDADLFVFNSRTDRTDKRIYNAVRNLINRNFYISKYEWDFIFNPECSAVIYKALGNMMKRGVKGVRQEGNTFYLYGAKNTDFNIKAYNITANEDAIRRNLPPKYLCEDRIKAESTYRRPWFYAHPDLTIRQLTTQNAIAALLSNDNKRLFATYFFDKLESDEKRALQKAASVTSRSELMNLFSNESSTQVSVDKCLSEISDIKKEIELLRSTMMRQDVRQDAFEARLNAIDGQSEKYIQKNKLRLVK